MLTKKLKKAWIKALTSGKYIQGTGQLKNRENILLHLGIVILTVDR